MGEEMYAFCRLAQEQERRLIVFAASAAGKRMSALTSQ